LDRFLLRVRVVFAPEQFHLGHLRTVAAAMAETQQARVAAGAVDIPGRDRAEQLLHDRLVGDVLRHDPARRDGAWAAGLGVEAALGHRDDALDERAQFLGTGDGRLNPLVPNQVHGLVAEHRDAMLRDATELPVCHSVTHDRIPSSVRAAGPGAGPTLYSCVP